MISSVNFVLLFAVFFPSQTRLVNNINVGKTNEILATTQKLLDFMFARAKFLNLDGLIGIRIYQGVLKSILANKETRLWKGILNQIRNQDSLSRRICEKSIRTLKKQTPVYYNKLWPMISDGFWKGSLPPRNINVSSLDRYIIRSETYGERFGDDCMSLLMGTSGNDKCTITLKCWKMMTAHGFSNYSLTHQVFYFLIGIETECNNNIEKMAASVKGSQTMPMIMDRLCSNVWRESNLLVENGLNLDYSDLLMEQIGLCGYAGYYKSFSNPKWIDAIISWQRPNGCYGIMENENFNLENLDPARYGTYRKKRAESLMSRDGCLAHKSTVAISALSTFLNNEI